MKSKKPYETKKCLNCEKEFVYSNGNIHKKYCDNVCQNAYQNKNGLRTKPIPYTKEFLEELYITNKISCLAISRKLKISLAQVSRYLKRYNIPTREFSTKGLQTRLGAVLSKSTKDKIGKGNLGKIHSPQHREKTKEWMLKNSPWKGKHHSLDTKIKLSEGRKGELSWNWKGGITPIHKKIRHTLELKLWREAVLERDDYTCQVCGIKKGKLQGMEVDHIKPFALFPELRTSIENGRTICNPCHRKTDTYGMRTTILSK